MSHNVWLHTLPTFIWYSNQYQSAFSWISQQHIVWVLSASLMRCQQCKIDYHDCFCSILKGLYLGNLTPLTVCCSIHDADCLFVMVESGGMMDRACSLTGTPESIEWVSRLMVERVKFYKLSSSKEPSTSFVILKRTICFRLECTLLHLMAPYYVGSPHIYGL